jgi:NitT/TauT family transport system permease protein
MLSRAPTVPGVAQGGAAARRSERSATLSDVEVRLHEQTLASQRKRRIVNQTMVAVGRALLIVVVLGGWSLASGRWLDAGTISNPLAVLAALRELIVSGRLWPELGETVAEVFTGYFAGAIGGAVLAFLFAVVPSAERVVRPFLLGAYSIPKIALAPLIVMWFGLGIAPKMILAGMFVFFIVFMNAVAGIQSVNHQLVRVLKVMGASRFAILRKIVLPTMLPFLLLGLRVSIPEAMTGAVIGEFISGSRGLGYLINSAANELNMAVSFAALIVLVIVVGIADFVLGTIERILPWQPPGSQSDRVGARQR